MGVYLSEVVTYDGKIANFKATVSEIISELDSYKKSLDDIEESSLRDNVVTKIEKIKEELDNIIDGLTSNASILRSKAQELDAEESAKRSTSNTISAHTDIKELTKEEDGERKVSTLSDNHLLNEEEDNSPKTSHALEVNLGGNVDRYKRKNLNGLLGNNDRGGSHYV